MGVQIIILLYVLISLDIFVSAQRRPKKNEIFKSTEDPYFTSFQFYFFEGVDYDFTDEDYLKEHNDCNGDFMRCLRSRVTLEPICAVDVVNWYIEDFDNICQLELFNCRFRVFNMREPVGGRDIFSNAAFYTGRDVDCIQHSSQRRRSEEAIKHLLGDKYEEVLAYRNDMLRRGVFKLPVTEPTQTETEGSSVTHK